MSEYLSELLPPALLYLALAAFFFGFVGAQLAQASEGFAKVLGPLGKYWRRKLAEEQMTKLAIFHERAREAVNSELGVARKAEYASLKDKLGDVLSRLADMERNEAVAEAYLVLDAEWHRQVNMMLAENGLLTAPLPTRSTYFEFADKYRTDRGWNKKQN